MEMETLKNAKTAERDTFEIGPPIDWEEEGIISLADFVRMITFCFIDFLAKFPKEWTMQRSSDGVDYRFWAKST